MALLALSRYLSFHARGDAAFVWHGLTGDVAEMSRDVLALLLAFSPAAEESVVAKLPPAGLSREQVEEFVPVLRARRMLVLAPSGGHKIDEMSPLLGGFPRVPRNAVFLRKEPAEGSAEPLQITLYDRDGKAFPLDPVTARLFDRCTGERTLGQVLGDAGPDALEPLLRLARADLAALKILPKKVTEGGLVLNPAAESTMPYPELADVRAYAAGAPGPGAEPSDLRGYHESIRDAEAQFEETETTLAHLFREPHPALKGKTFGAALAQGLLLRNALKGAQGRAPRMLEVGGGLGFVGQALREALSSAPEGTAGLRAINIDLSPALAAAQRRRGLAVARGDALHLPARPESLDLIISNEMVGDLGTGPEEPAAQAAREQAAAEAAASAPTAIARSSSDREPLDDADDEAAGAQGPGTPGAGLQSPLDQIAAQAGLAGPPGAAPPPVESGPRMINHGALAFLRQAAQALAPGGMLYLSEFGDPTAQPVRSTHLDHDEWSIRFADLQAEATRLGLGARVLPLTELIFLDGAPQALSTTRASFKALRALFAAHGLLLGKRAWLRTEIEAMCEGKLDLKTVQGLQWAPLGERTMGLQPKQFWALVATKPARTLH